MGAPESFCQACTATLKDIETATNNVNSKTSDVDTYALNVLSWAKKIILCRCVSYKHLHTTLLSSFENFLAKMKKELSMTTKTECFTRDAFQGYVLKLQDPKLTEDEFIEYMSNRPCFKGSVIKDFSDRQEFLKYMAALRGAERAAQLEAELVTERAAKDMVVKKLEELEAKCATIINGCGNC